MSHWLAISCLAAIITAALLLWWLIVSRTAQDPQAALMLQQMDALREQVARSLADHSKLLQGQFEAVDRTLRGSSGDINQRLDNAARLYAGLQSQLGQITQANQQIQGLMKDISGLQ